MSSQEQEKSLKRLLADSYILMLKTQNYHWNVTGMHFHSLHLLFEEQYTDLWTAVDLIAERIRALGILSPGSFASFQELSKINSEAIATKSEAMIQSLVEDHKHVVTSAKHLVQSAQSTGDDATMDLAIERIQVHEKYIWMMQSMLEK